MNDNHYRILLYIYYSKTKHVGRKELRREVFPSLSGQIVSRMLKFLEENNYIDHHLKDASQGARSEYLYHLRLKGAKAIGLKSLPSRYYTPPSELFLLYRSLSASLLRIAEKRNLLVMTNERDMRSTLNLFIEKKTGRYIQYSEDITPDFLIIGRKTIALCIIAHPNAGKGKAIQKAKQYEDFFSYIEIILVLLSERQRTIFQNALQDTPIKCFLASDFEVDSSSFA